MKLSRTLPQLPLLALITIGAAPATAQDGADKPGAHAPDKDRELKAPRFLAIEAGSATTIENGDGTELGTAADYVFTRNTGRITHVVLSIPGSDVQEARLVPFARFRWDAKEERLRLPQDADSLEEYPLYDPEALIGPGASTMANAHAKHAGEASGKAAAKHEDRVWTSSRALSAGVYAGQEPIATVGRLLFEVHSGTVTFLTARQGAEQEEQLLVPWRVLSLEARDDSQPARLVLERDLAELEAAPRLAAGDEKRLSDPAFRKQVYDFYGLIPPAAPRERS